MPPSLLDLVRLSLEHLKKRKEVTEIVSQTEKVINTQA